MDLAQVTRPGPPPAQRHAWARSRVRVAACAALAVAFAAWAVVVASGWLSGADRSVMRWMAEYRNDFAETVAGAIVTLATPQVLIAVTLAVGAWRAATRRAGGILVHVGVRVGLLVLSVVVLKDVIARPGPALHASFRFTPLSALSQMTQVGQGGAFPSGHTTSTLVCVAVLLSLFGAGSQVRRIVLAVSVAAVSAALLYMGFHWFTDVVGAWLLGGTILAVPVPAVSAYEPDVR